MNIQKDIWTMLQESQKPILIYGMGDGCDKILGVCREKGILVQGIFASDDHVTNKVIHGFPVMGYTEAKAKYGDMIALLAFGVFRDDLMAQILKMNEECELFAPEVPLFGGELFDMAYYKKHEEELREVREMLSDEASRQVLDDLIEYKLTGRLAPLIRCQSEREADYRKLIPYRAGDVYADLGSYDGDTVLEWDALHPDHGKLLAVEPNEKTYQKLMKNCAEVPHLFPVQAAVWSRNETLLFNGKSGRSSAVSESGKVEVGGISLDSVLERADFIKFDVEGAEREAIEGAEGLIRRCRPTLCISAYHRTEDLFAIPLQVKKICPEYGVFLRHWQYIPAWDTVFFFSTEK